MPRNLATAPPAHQTVTVTVDLSPARALALAQFVKRLYWADLRSHAVNDEETYLIRDAVDALQRALAEAGYAPR